MTDLLTLPASDLVARINVLEAEVDALKTDLATYIGISGDLATENARLDLEFDLLNQRVCPQVRGDLTRHCHAAHTARTEALEAAALLADGAGQHCLSAAIRGLRR